ncbi:ARF GAP with effector function(s) [Saxophila tyrrhenica]|uniref:ARF GAP with effector function(S) n=1 Tax=Saxophila tyrrhenica TaxID=1690608 RepID=A0AAV9P6P5_9PEZI|nr:ARF GAP with effector function(s) [Saxophila tyrrhenica]
MSRRPPPAGADRSEQNRATLKQLVKLESNKSCADCKRNKHPRWASWNIGVFICIRCSGIHRGMGTHISRVKSVDLDSWTDEQMQSMLRWGNARANRYWESKLAEGHVPNESKIENFIRTKYDSKRWAMDGPVPDPSTLDVPGEGGDDDVPLNVVREKVVGDRERSTSGNARNGSGVLPPPGGGQRSAPPARPSSTGASTPGVPGRADLKSSILSLYASKPAAAPQPQPQQQQSQQQQSQQSNASFFGGMQSPPLTSPTQQPSSSFGGMNDAFGSLSFSSPQQSQAKPTPFSNFSPPQGHARQPSASKSALSGGSFFDTKPAAPAKPTQPTHQPREESFGGDFGDFSSAVSPPPTTTVRSPPAATSNMNNLFDLQSSPPPPPKPAVQSPPPIQPQQQQPKQPNFSAFNLSQPSAPAKQPSPPQTQTSTFGSLSNMDAWGSNDAWATPEPAQQPQPAPFQSSSSSFNKPAAPAAPMQTEFDSGWGDMTSPAPPAANTTTSAGGFSVQQDEEFGGWSHASPVAQTPGAKQGGGFGGGSDDLFGNVWE